jgi:hypothetical protein
MKSKERDNTKDAILTRSDAQLEIISIVHQRVVAIKIF